MCFTRTFTKKKNIRNKICLGGVNPMTIQYKRPTDVRVTVENSKQKTTLYLNEKGNVVKDIKLKK